MPDQHPHHGRAGPRIHGKAARQLIARQGGDIWLQIDGGVSEETIERCAEAGADMFVAGTAVYGAQDPAAAVKALRELATAVARP